MAVSIPFQRELRFEYGVVEQISPLIRRIVARNPGPFTFHGTGTYILGRGQVAVIDPGPALPKHVDALVNALAGERISHVLVTHSHRDHSPACRLLRQVCAAETYGYGPHGAGKREQGVQVEEGGDMNFIPDVTIRDGEVVEGADWSVECVYTPGHTSNHMCFQLREEQALFSGDHVMGWSTSIIAPPDGDMRDYLASLERLLARDDQVYWPTHGPCVNDPKALVRALIEHRREREQQILDCLAQGYQTIAEMVPAIYHDLPPRMFPAAAQSTFAAVIHLNQQGRLEAPEGVLLEARYRLPKA